MTVAPIMVRARITRDEWEAIRVRAIRENRSTADLVAEAIRAYLALSPNGRTDTK